MFNTFISRVKTRLEQPLPGVDAQYRLAAASRAKFVEVPENALPPRDPQEPVAPVGMVPEEDPPVH